MQRLTGYLLLVIMLGLISLGMVMLLSTSGRFAPDASIDLYAPLRRQIVWMVLGGVVCLLMSRVDYHAVLRYSWIWIGIAAFLLILCYVPGIGKAVKGAHRWLQVGGLTLQPSEFAKWALVCFLAHWLGQNRRRIHEFGRGVAIPAAVTGVLALLVIREPDLGSTVMMGFVLGVMMMCAGVKWRYLLPMPVMGISGILALAYFMPERRGRLLAFLDIEKHKQGDGWQVYQALVAFGSGGTSGLGLGNSRQKMFWLPEAHTDFVFPIVGEELGVWITLTVVLAFLVLTLCGGWISMHAPDPSGVLLGIGITTLLSIQALMNLCVVTGLIPNKGVPLPFISYGGSNLMICMAGLGLLFNLQRHGVYEEVAASPLRATRSTPRL